MDITIDASTSARNGFSFTEFFLTHKGDVTLAATCVPKSIPATSKLFIAATWAGATRRNGAGTATCRYRVKRDTL